MFVLERKVATFSLYAHEGALVEFSNGYTIEEDASGGAALTFARQVLDDPEVYFPPAVVFDIGKISTGKWIVIERNPAWGSGIYGCDPFQVLPVLKRACVPAELAADHDPRAFMFR